MNKRQTILKELSEIKFLGQRYCCCSLIAAVNARIWLGGNLVSDEDFEALVDLVGCRNGAAIGVEKAYPSLGLTFEDGIRDLKWVTGRLPVEIAYFDEQFGFHSALVACVAGGYIALVNSSRPYLRWDEIKFPKWRHQQVFRSFLLL